MEEAWKITLRNWKVKRRLLIVFEHLLLQEKRSQSGLGRRHEEIKEVSEPIKEETTSSHDAKAARATWRKYAKHLVIPKSESPLLIPSVILDLLPWVQKTSGFGQKFRSKIRKGAVKTLHS